eukprot:gene732-906_t
MARKPFIPHKMLAQVLLTLCVFPSCNLKMKTMGMYGEKEVLEPKSIPTEIRMANGALDIENKVFHKCHRMSVADVDLLIRHPCFITLMHLNLCGANLGKPGLERLMPVLDKLPHLKTLNLQSNNIDREELKVLAPHLEKIATRLETFSLANSSMNGLNFQIIESALQRMVRLKDLDFYISGMGDEGMVILAKAMESMPFLTKLNLRGNYLTHKVIIDLTRALKLPHLEVLILRENDILGPNYDKRVDVNPYQRIVMDNRDVKEVFTPDQRDEMRTLTDPNEGAPLLADAIAHLHKLKEIDLGAMQLSHVGMLHLAHAFRSCPDLEILGLNVNILGNKGAQHVAEALLHLPKLTALKISRNDIGDGGAKALTVALAKLPKLRILEIENYLISGEVYRAIMETQRR